MKLFPSWYGSLTFSMKHIREFRAKGNPLTFPLTFPLVLREKLREIPSQILFGLREISQTETAFPLGRFAWECQAYTEK